MFHQARQGMFGLQNSGMIGSVDHVDDTVCFSKIIMPNVANTRTASEVVNVDCDSSMSSNELGKAYRRGNVCKRLFSMHKRHCRIQIKFKHSN